MRVSDLQHAPSLLTSLGIATVVAASAWRARLLSPGGAAAATATGTLALGASWGWGALLILWFVLAALLSLLGRAEKAVRVALIVVKGSNRDARQVLANGGIFAAAALGAIVAAMHGAEGAPWRAVLGIAGAGALAAAGADTWATEIGTRYGDRPWSLRTRSRVSAGTSGAMTWPGTAGLVLAAVLLAALASVLTVIPSGLHTAAAVAAGGVAGALADTLLGAWVQQRRWCPRCGMETEQVQHACGSATTAIAGIPLLENDAVNALCSLTGALTAVVLALP